MKIATALLALPAVFGLKKSPAIRKLNDAQDEYDAEVDEYEFLQNYEQVYMTCDSSMKVVNQEGEYEYGAVVTRFCPNGVTCDKDGKKKCEGGYGDYVVGIQTYMEQFMEQFERRQEQQNQYNQNNGEDEEEFDFNFAEFGECKEFNVENQNNQDGYDEEQEEVAYFIGPKCSEGDISIALFTDEDCKYESVDVTFKDLTGVDLPWSNSIIEDEDCTPYYCYGANENGEYEYNDFCTQVYEQANLKCEENMESYSPYGQTVSGCETIAAMLPSSSGGAAGVFFIILLVAAVVGFGIWYFLQQKKKSAVSQEGLMM